MKHTFQHAGARSHLEDESYQTQGEQGLPQEQIFAMPLYLPGVQPRAHKRNIDEEQNANDLGRYQHALNGNMSHDHDEEPDRFGLHQHHTEHTVLGMPAPRPLVMSPPQARRVPTARPPPVTQQQPASHGGYPNEGCNGGSSASSGAPRSHAGVARARLKGTPAPQAKGHKAARGKGQRSRASKRVTTTVQASQVNFGDKFPQMFVKRASAIPPVEASVDDEDEGPLDCKALLVPRTPFFGQCETKEAPPSVPEMAPALAVGIRQV